MHICRKQEYNSCVLKLFSTRLSTLEYWLTTISFFIDPERRDWKGWWCARYVRDVEKKNIIPVSWSCSPPGSRVLLHWSWDTDLKAMIQTQFLSFVCPLINIRHDLLLKLIALKERTRWWWQQCRADEEFNVVFDWTWRCSALKDIGINHKFINLRASICLKASSLHQIT